MNNEVTYRAHKIRMNQHAHEAQDWKLARQSQTGKARINRASLAGLGRGLTRLGQWLEGREAAADGSTAIQTTTCL